MFNIYFFPRYAWAMASTFLMEFLEVSSRALIGGRLVPQTKENRMVRWLLSSSDFFETSEMIPTVKHLLGPGNHMILGPRIPNYSILCSPKKKTKIILWEVHLPTIIDVRIEWYRLLKCQGASGKEAFSLLLSWILKSGHTLLQKCASGGSGCIFSREIFFFDSHSNHWIMPPHRQIP